MNYILYIIISIVILAVIFVTIILFRSGNKDKNEGDLIVKKNCTPSDPKNLISCDPVNDVCASDICSNELTKCYTVNKVNPYKVNIDGNLYDVPDGNWCLPLKASQDKCNPVVSTALLAKDKDQLKWICDCKYPNLFTKESVDSDCTKQLACVNVLEGVLQGETTGRGSLVSLEGDKYDFTYDPRSAKCICEPGYLYKNLQNGEIKHCVRDSCFPGNLNDVKEEGCICPEPKQDFSTNLWTSYARCPQDVKDKFKTSCEANPQCIKNPCGENGYYDKGKKDCVCNPGYSSTDSIESVVGKYCKVSPGP
jgi:hypothetical protein